ncbi:MAG: hypothetical protein IKX77_00870, partial [Clostridia bacterium]|nr:hypothetical protein [Clostridia bacterium]
FHMVLAKIFSKTDIINRAGRFFPDFIRRALNFDKNLCGCLVFGLVSGFPNGAVSCGETYKKGLCSKSDAEYAISLCNFPSLAFLCLIAGKTALGGLKGGIILYASSLIAVFVLSLILKTDETAYSPYEITQKNGVSGVIVSSVKESAENMIYICAFIISFSVLSGLILNFIPLNNAFFTCAFKGIFEMTSGIISAKDISFPQNYVIASFLSGFSGFSVIFQVSYVCSFYGLSAEKFVYSRIINVILMPVITVLLLLILPRNFIQA